MTSLLAWVGVDQRGPGSLYLAADSRISWPDGSFWDLGRKLFASTLYPELFGYCGDAFFPTHMLSQVVDTINLGLLLDVAHRPKEKVERLESVIGRSLSTYPAYRSFTFQLLYCTREGEGMGSIFRVFLMSFEFGKLHSAYELPLPTHSGMVEILGSGSAAMKGRLAVWEASELKQTSRAMFAAFCEAVQSGEDPKSGGIPQLAGMNRKGGGRICGVIHNGSRGVCGVDLEPQESGGGIEWFNGMFELCDGTTGQRRDGAKPQPRPKSL